MKGFIRIIIWSIFTSVLFILGVVGLSRYIASTSLNDDEKNSLNTISNYYNNSQFLNILKSKNTLSESYIKRNKLIVTYSNEIIETKYEFTYKNNNLSIKINNDDENGWTVAKLIVDAISVSKGKSETETYTNFENIIINKISNDEAFIVVVGEEETDINIRTDISLQTNNSSELINYNLLEDNLDKISDFNYSYVEDNIILTMYKNGNKKIIKLTQIENFNENSYNLINKLMSYVLDNNEYIEFNNLYPNISNEEFTNFSNYEIENKKEDKYYILTIYINEKNSVDELINSQG